MEERKDAIASRWVDAVLSAYPEDAAALFRRQQDPFANPLGHHVREGTRGILGTILDGSDPEEVREDLDRIVRIRAVQELTPGEALGFVFSLRSIVREVIPEAETDPRHRKELARLDRAIDQVALVAFDLYAARREEVSRLRINEVKRQVAWIFEKLNRRGDPMDAPEDSNRRIPGDDTVHREDL